MMHIIFLSILFLLTGCNTSYPDLTEAPPYEKSPLTPDEIQKDMKDLRQEKAKLQAN